MANREADLIISAELGSRQLGFNGV